MKKRIEEVISKKINPLLVSHGGSIELLNFNNNNLTIKFNGACANCPSSAKTLENIVTVILKEELPELKDIHIHQGVSDELIDIAKKILNI